MWSYITIYNDELRVNFSCDRCPVLCADFEVCRHCCSCRIFHIDIFILVFSTPSPSFKNKKNLSLEIMSIMKWETIIIDFLELSLGNVIFLSCLLYYH